MRRISIPLLTAGLIIAGTLGASAQTPTSDSPCVGTWRMSITALGQPSSAARPGLATFHADGTYSEASQPVVPGPPDAPENVSFSSAGQGVWAPTEAGACAVTFAFYNADAKGSLATTIDISIVLMPGADGDTLTTVGTDFATVTAADGTVLFSGPGNTVEGTRMVVSLPPAPGASPSA